MRPTRSMNEKRAATHGKASANRGKIADTIVAYSIPTPIYVLQHGTAPLQYATSINEHMIHLRQVCGLSGLYVTHGIYTDEDGAYRDEWTVFHGGEKAHPNDKSIATIRLK